MSCFNLTAHGATDVGRKRARNEDAFLVVPVRAGPSIVDVVWPLDVSKCPALLAVADGVGGGDAGDIASKLALDTLRSSLQVESERSALTDALKVSVERAHGEVRRAGAAQIVGPK